MSESSTPGAKMSKSKIAKAALNQKNESQITLADLEQIYDDLSETSLPDQESKYEKITNFDKIEGTHAKKLAIQIIIKFHNNYPDKSECTVNAIVSCIQNTDSDLRKTAYVILRQIDQESILFDRLTNILIMHLPSIENESERKLFLNTLNHHLDYCPEKSLAELFDILNKYSGSSLLILLKFCDDFQLKHKGIILTNEIVNEKMINACEKIIAGDDYSVMIPTLDLLLLLPAMNSLKMRLILIERFKSALNLTKPYTLTSIEDKQRIKNTFDILHCVDKLFSDYLPIAPSMNVESQEDPNLQLSLIEPLFFILYQLMSKERKFNEIVKNDADFMLQLGYFARINQNSISRLKSYFEQQPELNFETEQVKTCTFGFIISQNIQNIVKDLIRKIPLYNVENEPAWKMLYSDMSAIVLKMLKPVKANTPTKTESKDFKKERSLYAPPIGKYSKVISPKRTVGKQSTNELYRKKLYNNQLVFSNSWMA
ncbi:MAG: Apoptosis inhibitor 5 [Marteilia pararefringens]